MTGARVREGGGGPGVGELEGRGWSEHHCGARAGAGLQSLRLLGVRGRQPRREVGGEAPQLSLQPALLAAASALSI